jgi:hypothetical protein
VLDEQVEARPALDPARFGRAHDEVEDGIVVLGVVGLGPHLTDGTQTEGFGPVLHDHGDVLHAGQHRTEVAVNQRRVSFLPLVAETRRRQN